MKKNIYFLLTLLLTLVLASCQADDLLPNAQEQEITLVIPEYPTTRATWPTPGAPGQWEVGDKLYFKITYYNPDDEPIGDPHYPVALRTGSGWVFSAPIVPPAGTARINIVADYAHEYNPENPALNALVLSGTTSTTRLSGNIPLDPFELAATRLTFTGLTEGDEVSFAPYQADSYVWHITSFTLTGESEVSIPTLTADATGTLTLYANCEVNEAPLYFRINGQPNAEDQWHTFNPGAFPAGQEDYVGQHYTIDCTGLSGGSKDLDQIARDAERTRFLAWADRCRKITSGYITEGFTLMHDIDLSGIDWKPIAPDATTTYIGTFDGGGHTISGMTIKDVPGDYAGMFGYLGRATVKNLTLRGAMVSGTTTYAGALAGQTMDSYLIACRITGCQVTGSFDTGGITGAAISSTFVACHTLGGSVVGNSNAGGLAGYSYDSNFTACVAQPTRVKSDSNPTGALVGQAAQGSLTVCWWHPYKTEEDDTATRGKDIGTNNGATISGVDEGDGELSTPTGIDADAATKMNAAIEAYNNNPGTEEGHKCTFRWGE